MPSQNNRHTASILIRARARNRNRNRFSNRLLAAVCVLLAFFLVVACGKSGPKTPENAAAPGSLAPVCAAPTRPDRPASWEGDPLQLTAIDSDGTSLTLRVRLPEGAAPPDGSQPSGLNLTLPYGGAAAARLAGCTVGGQALGGSHPGIEASIRLRQVGLARNWPIWHLDLLRPFWDQIRRQAGGRQGAIDVTLTLAVRPASAGQPTRPTDPRNPMRRVVEKLVVNPGDLDRWEAVPPVGPPPTDPRPLAKDAKQWLKAVVAANGLYRIAPEALQSAGLIGGPADLDRVRLFALGKPVPVMVAQPGQPAGIYFYGEASPSPYGRQRAYWITLSAGAPAARWPVSTSATLPVERIDRVRGVARLDRDRQRIMKRNDLLSVTGIDWVDSPVSDTLLIELPLVFHRPVTGAGRPLQARLHFIMHDVHDDPLKPADWTGTVVALGVGGRELARHRFSAAAEETWAPELPADILREGTTTLALSVVTPTTATGVRAESQIWFDWMDLAYPARPALVGGRFEFTADSTTAGLARVETQSLQAAAPPVALQFGERIEAVPERDGSILVSNLGGRRAEIYDPAQVPTLAVETVAWDDDALDAKMPVDYLIIVHPSLKAALDPLVALNKDRGLATRIVEIGAVYDLFGDGVFNPEAIRRLLGHTQAWPGGAPSYVLLVGDCTSDYLGQLHNDIPQLVPSYSYHTDETWASDAWFAMFSGADDLADAMLGRISVNNLDDARSVVDKTVRYARGRMLGPWRARLTYIADETEHGQRYREAAEELRSRWTPPAFENDCIYMDEIPLEDNWYMPSEALARIYARENKMMKVSRPGTDRILKQFDEGTACLDFFGHGSPNIWCDERLLFGGDTPNRDTLHFKPVAGRYAFIANYTCNTGAIDYPEPPWNVGISEDLMRTPDAGAVGMFLPSGPSDTPSQMMLAHQWRRAMFADGERGFGELITLTRLRFELGDGPRQMLYMYLLLGDPASKIQLAGRWQRLDVGAAAVNPDLTDVRRVARLTDVKPESGQALVWVEDIEGRTLWEAAPAPYRDGRLDLPFQIPATVVTPARLRVGVYGWNDAQGQDFTAGALLDARRPWVKIASVGVEHASPERSVRVRLVNAAPVPSGNLLLALARDGAEIANRQLRLDPGEARDVALPVPWTGDAGALEAVLTPSRPPDDAQAPLVERLAFAVAGDKVTTRTAPVSAARVRIVPASIKHEPEPVTEGQTIHVMFEVENAGQAPSAPFFAELLDDAPEKGGKVLPMQPVLPPVEIPALGPGRTWPVTLRWDPVYNAGVRKVWLRLRPVSGPPSANAVEQTASHSIFVRTKWKLTRSRPIRQDKRTEEDRKAGVYRLHAYVGNLGQTEAHGVEVTFFTGPEKRDDQVMGRVILPRVPAATNNGIGEAEAELVWTLDPKKYPGLSPAHVKVTIEIRLLGSTQRTGG